MEYFANAVRGLSGTLNNDPNRRRLLRIETDPTITGLPKDLQWSARYTANFIPTQTGVQKFSLYGSGSAKLFIADKFMGEYLRADFSDGIFASVPADRRPIRPHPRGISRPAIRWARAARDQFDLKLGVYTALGWAAPDDLINQAAQTAKQADVAVVFVGQRLGEGMDRMTLALPNDQDALIEAVAKANLHTLVVLNTGGGVTMPWLDKVAGVLEMWLPGDAYGSAAAKLLFGDAEPGGRLPVT